MRTVVFLLAALWISTASAAEKKNRSYFFNCDRDDECVLVNNGCPGGIAALNRIYVKEALAFWQITAPDLACAAAQPKTDNVKAWCVQNKCDAH